MRALSLFGCLLVACASTEVAQAPRSEPAQTAVAASATSAPTLSVASSGSDGDRDADGIHDANDRCPEQPEDRDGYQDEDGCADPDNDNDRVLDVNDRCPNEPEIYNGYQDEDGCQDDPPRQIAHKS